MSRSISQLRVTRLAVLAGLALLALGCPSNSPTAPKQTPAPQPPGPSANWVLTVSAKPNELVAGSTEPVTVTVRARRADTGDAPPHGTTIVLSSNLGDFDSLGSGLREVVLALLSGRAEIQLFAGSVTGSALLNARLEGSVGQAVVPVVPAIEPVLASFSFTNTNDDLDVTFQNTSTGNPTKFHWSFGDGRGSTLQHPTHRYDVEGDYVVTLTASKPGSKDTFSQVVGVTEEELQADFQFANSQGNLSVAFQNTSTGRPTRNRWNFGDGKFSSEKHPTHIFPGEGDFVVELTVFRNDLSSAVSKIVTVDAQAPAPIFVQEILPATGAAGGGTSVTITGQGFTQPLSVSFGGKLGDVTSVTSTKIVVKSPPGDLANEDCDQDGDGNIDGTRTLDTTVPITVTLGEGGSYTVSNAFTYLSPDGEACNLN